MSRELDINKQVAENQIVPPVVEGMKPASVMVKTNEDQPYDEAPSFQKLQAMLLEAKPKKDDNQIERNKKLAQIRALGSIGESLADMAAASKGVLVKANTQEDPFILRSMKENRDLQDKYLRENADWYRQYSNLHKEGLSDWARWKMERDRLKLLEDKLNKEEIPKETKPKEVKPAPINKTKPYIDVRDSDGNMLGVSEGDTQRLWKAIIADAGQDEKKRLEKLIQFDEASGTFKNVLALKGLVAERAKNYPDIMEQIRETSKKLYPYYTIQTQKTPTTTTTQTTDSDIKAAKSLIKMVEKDYGTGTTANHIYSAFKIHGYTEEEAKAAAKAWVKSKQKK